MDIYCDFNTTTPQKHFPSLLEKEQLKAQLLLNIRSCLSYLLPRGVFRGDKFYVGDVQGNKGKSMVVELLGNKVGLWHDFSTGEGGDIFDLWAIVTGKNQFIDTTKDIAKWLGYSEKMTLWGNQQHHGTITMKTTKLLLQFTVMTVVQESDIFLLM